MIRITYSQAQSDIAEAIRDDLAGEVDSAHPLLIVLVSRQAVGDPFVQAEIQRALDRGEAILPLLLDDTALPATLTGFHTLNFQAGYNREVLLPQLSRASRSRADVRRANRRALAVVGGIAALMFALAIVAISGGLVAFPVDEYNEEATLQAQWIGGLIGETLEYVQPRSSEDARNFAVTFEAAPTRLHFYIRGTATALAKGN
ncbi:MAG: TIR domain-containing protein [Chloroflexi bacterium]|nr:TIR domain-containing protein [Chloroflexota bacterium]